MSAAVALPPSQCRNMSSGGNEVLTLDVSPALHIDGEEITGEVSLNFHSLQRMPIEVHLKLRGFVFTCVDCLLSLFQY